MKLGYFSVLFFSLSFFLMNKKHTSTMMLVVQDAPVCRFSTLGMSKGTFTAFTHAESFHPPGLRSRIFSLRSQATIVYLEKTHRYENPWILFLASKFLYSDSAKNHCYSLQVVRFMNLNLDKLSAWFITQWFITQLLHNIQHHFTRRWESFVSKELQFFSLCWNPDQSENGR